MLFDVQILAYIAIAFLSLNLIPQIYLIIQNKNAGTISYSTYFMNIISSILLIIYAYTLQLYPILIGNIMIFIASGIIIFLKHKYN